MASVLKSKSFTLGTNTAQTEVFNWEDVASRAKQYIDTVREQAQQLLRDSQKGGVMVMAYSPLGQGAILTGTALAAIGNKHGVTPAAIALAMLLRQPGVVVIPKAVRQEHVRANAVARDVVLDEADLAALDQAFPMPNKKMPLAML